jgi:large-conductance mechanosensitive channel
MASPSYGINVVALALAVVLAAALVFLLAQLVPQLADLMMPPPLSGAH